MTQRKGIAKGRADFVDARREIRDNRTAALVAALPPHRRAALDCESAGGFMSPTNPTTWRRYSPLRYSLRSALLLMLLAAVLLGAWRIYLLPFQRQQVAAQALRDAGAKIETKIGGPRWLRLGLSEELFQQPTFVNLDEVEFNDELMPYLLRLSQTESLVVSGEGFTSEHLQRLRALPHLRILVLDSTSVREADSLAFDRQYPDLRLHRSQARAIAVLRDGGHMVNDHVFRAGQLSPTRAQSAPTILLKRFARRGYVGAIGPGGVMTRSNVAWAPIINRPGAGTPPIAANSLQAKFGQRHFEIARSITIPYMARSSTFSHAAAQLKHLTTLTQLDIGRREYLDDDFALLPQLPRLRRMQFNGRRMSNDVLAQLTTRMPQLVELDLNQSQVTDEGLRHLANLPKLGDLQLQRTHIGDDGMARLVRVKQLQSIDLERTRVGDAGMAYLAKIAQLEELKLGHTEVTDVGMRHIGRLTNLKILDLRETSVGNQGLCHLARLKNLEVLDLRATNVSDAGLVHLAEMQNLHTLHLAHTDITDECGEHLRYLKSLKWLDLSFTKFSLQATLELEKHLPLNPIVR